MEELFNYLPKSFQGPAQWLEWIGIFFFVLIVFEIGFDYLSRNKGRDFKQSLADFGVFIGHEAVGKLGGALIFLSALLFFERFKVFDLGAEPWTWGAGLLLADFLYYWSHRLEHRSRFFWMWHNVHHSSSDYNGTTALRLSWLEPFVSWYLLVPMVILGFNPFQVLILFQILLTYQTWIHTKKIGKLGILEKILNTPSSHRVHHGSNPEYLDKNFGALLIIWDKIFDTYAPESKPVRYGLTKAIKTNHPIKINLLVPIEILKGLKKVRGIKNQIYWVFGPPEWNPNS